MKISTIQMESVIADFFNPRQNLIVPNISWGLQIHECDLLIITPAGYASEVEIKISKSDLIKDKKKLHKHKDNRIKCLYFGLPDSLTPHIAHVPPHAGIIIVKTNFVRLRCEIVRHPQINFLAQPFTLEEKFKVARLGTLRIWSLKKKIIKLSKKKI